MATHGSSNMGKVIDDILPVAENADDLPEFDSVLVGQSISQSVVQMLTTGA